MAIYHLEAKVISRGNGRSACAAAAYMSCSAILIDYDGIQHDYTRKQGLVWQNVFLPEYAPHEWKDREKLWNAVEENEKTKDSRLAREFVVALPIELGKEQWQTLLNDFVQNQFVSDGMCVDVAIHDTNGHNPHAHIMLTVRPLDKNGTWQYKTEKEYLCVRDGEERGFTAAEYKVAQSDGWEKQYQYKVGKKKVYMTPSAAEAQGYERVNKYSQSTKYGRQNPIAARWNSEEQLVQWRKAWADTVNRFLEKEKREERIDHRSHAERGLDEQPTIHEGTDARIMEQKGIVSDRCELNRQIKVDNVLLREMKAQVKKMTEAIKNAIPTIAETLEKLRANIMIFCYQLAHIRNRKHKQQEYLNSITPQYERYISLNAQIKDVRKERRDLIGEKKQLSVIQVIKHRELTANIAALTEKLEEFHSEKAFIAKGLECKADNAGEMLRKSISATENNLQSILGQEEKYAAELETLLSQYNELKEQSSELDATKLYHERMSIRSSKESDAVQRLRNAYGDKFSPALLMNSMKDVCRLVEDKGEKQAARQNIRTEKADIEQQNRGKNANRMNVIEWE